MSIEQDVNNWLVNMRRAFQMSPVQFKPANWLFITEHVLNDYPCRPISERMIWRLFFITPAIYKTTTNGVKAANRIFVYINDKETNLQWRFTVEIKVPLTGTNPGVASIVSAYPKDINGQITYPDQNNCCFSSPKIMKCEAFKNKILRMP